MTTYLLSVALKSFCRENVNFWEGNSFAMHSILVKIERTFHIQTIMNKLL